MNKSISATIAFLVGCFFSLGFAAAAHADCGGALAEQIASAERIVESLRPDKAGQMRVFASNGSEFTAGQAQWMKGQLRDIRRDCTLGDEQAASARLRGVQELLNAHRKT